MIVVMIMNDEAACIASVQNSLESKVLCPDKGASFGKYVYDQMFQRFSPLWYAILYNPHRLEVLE